MNNRTVATPQVTAPIRAFMGFFKNLGRRNCLLINLAFVAIVLAFNSSRLASMGIPPLLLSILPCLAMCALGMCKRENGSGSGRSKPATPGSSATAPSR